MSSWVIVAVPREDDYVNKISSEKVAHMTLLFLGDNPDLDLEAVTQYIQHVTNTSMPRFGLSVDRRGELGPDQADVLFFDGKYGFLDRIKQFRANLLKNTEIFRAYSSVEQYPEWTPHLTLGYPETPAHEDDRDYPGINWVSFDRIALWNDDYDGPEFVMPDDEGLETVAAWSEGTNNMLQHFGVKGMRWGVKNEPDVVLTKKCKNGTELTVTKDPDMAHLKLIGKAFPKFQENLDKNPMFTLRNKEGKKVGDAYFKQDTPDSLNLMWIGVNPKHRGNGYSTAAMEGVVKYAQAKDLKRLTLEVPGNAPDARHIYEKLGFKDTGKIVSVNDPMWGGLTEMAYDLPPKKKLQHSGIDQKELFEYIFDALNSKTEAELEDESEEMAQSMSSEEFLQHFGTKGMRWGVRTRSDGSTVGKPRAKEYSEDASKVREIKTKAKATGKTSLSNEELQTAITRMNLEQQFSNLNQRQKNAGQKFAEEMLRDIGKDVVKSTVKDVTKIGINSGLDAAGVKYRVGGKK